MITLSPVEALVILILTHLLAFGLGVQFILRKLDLR